VAERLQVLVTWFSFFLLLFFAIMHYLQPDDSFFQTAGVAILGWLFGKASNGVGKSRH
jgi:hypothetical protein